MTQLTGTFEFKEYYEHRNFSRQEARVLLKIDYTDKTFSIVPHPSTDQSFKFVQTSREYKMWLAVLKCIERAIEFANAEIGVTPKVECDL